ALPRRRAESRRRRPAHGAMARRASGDGTGVETARPHPCRTPPEMGSRATRQVRRRQDAAEGLAVEVRRADGAGYERIAETAAGLVLGCIWTSSPISEWAGVSEQRIRGRRRKATT